MMILIDEVNNADDIDDQRIKGMREIKKMRKKK